MSNPLLLKNSTQTALPDNTVQPTSTPSLDYTTFTQNWTQTSAISANWSAISSSANGQYVSACINPGAIYTSNNYGTTWTAITTSNGVSANSLAWTGIALSASGQYQIATVNTGAIYYSSTFGASWTASATAASSIVASGTMSIAVAVSSSGIYATAVVTGGQIWYTINYGANWTAITTNQGISSNTLNWSAITMSSTGVTQVATISTGLIYYSLNTGQTWTASNAASSAWAAVGMSASGQYVTAVAGPNIISSSSDYGKTWTNQSATFAWQAVAVSSSGQYQIVGGTGVIYYSTNYGSTWITSTNSYNVKCATMSYTGQYVMVAVNGGLVYCAITRVPGLFTSGSIILGNSASNNQPQISYTQVGVGSTTNYGTIGFNGANTLCWTAGGSVGIGTTAPGAKLEVNGIIRSTTGYFSTYAPGGTIGADNSFLGQIGFIDPAGYAQGGYGAYIACYGMGGSGTYGAELRFYTNAVSGGGTLQRMVIDKLGNVGIGTNAPAYALDVNGSLRASAYIPVITASASVPVWYGTTPFTNNTWNGPNGTASTYLVYACMRTSSAYNAIAYVVPATGAIMSVYAVGCSFSFSGTTLSFSQALQYAPGTYVTYSFAVYALF